MTDASTHLRSIADAIAELPADALERVEREARAIVDRAGGPPMRGKKRRGLLVTMARNQHVELTGDGATFRVQGTVPGWLWFDSGTRPHRIPRRRSGRMRRLTIAHPGTAGRHRWRQVARQLERRVPEIVRDEIARAVR